MKVGVKMGFKNKKVKNTERIDNLEITFKPINENPYQVQFDIKKS